MMIKDVLTQSTLPLLEKQILLAYILNCTRVQLITQDHNVLTKQHAQRFKTMEARRIAGEPIAYLVGTREFYGLILSVTPDVLIPRPETEQLVDFSLNYIKNADRPIRLLELCTGSGAIALAIADNTNNSVEIIATDISAAAIAVAQKNLINLAQQFPNTESLNKVHFVVSDGFSALNPQQHFNLIIANPPYIAENDPHLTQGDLQFEPKQALVSAQNGLALLTMIIQAAPHYLTKPGYLVLEHGYKQAAEVRALMHAAHYQSITCCTDLAGNARITYALV